MSKKFSLVLSIIAFSIAGIALGLSVEQFFTLELSANFVYLLLVFLGALIAGINLVLFHNKVKKI